MSDLFPHRDRHGLPISCEAANDAILHLLNALAEGLLAAALGPDGQHRYLSTACYHGQHEPVCGGAQHARGDDKPPHCKFCAAPCICPCHSGVEMPKAARVHDETCAIPGDHEHLGWCGPDDERSNP